MSPQAHRAAELASQLGRRVASGYLQLLSRAPVRRDRLSYGTSVDNLLERVLDYLRSDLLITRLIHGGSPRSFWRTASRAYLAGLPPAREYRLLRHRHRSIAAYKRLLLLALLPAEALTPRNRARSLQLVEALAERLVVSPEPTKRRVPFAIDPKAETGPHRRSKADRRGKVLLIDTAPVERELGLRARDHRGIDSQQARLLFEHLHSGGERHAVRHPQRRRARLAPGFCNARLTFVQRLDELARTGAHLLLPASTPHFDEEIVLESRYDGTTLAVRPGEHDVCPGPGPVDGLIADESATGLRVVALSDSGIHLAPGDAMTVTPHHGEPLFTWVRWVTEHDRVLEFGLQILGRELLPARVKVVMGRRESQPLGCLVGLLRGIPALIVPLPGELAGHHFELDHGTGMHRVQVDRTLLRGTTFAAYRLRHGNRVLDEVAREITLRRTPQLRTGPAQHEAAQ